MLSSQKLCANTDPGSNSDSSEDDPLLQWRNSLILNRSRLDRTKARLAAALSQCSSPPPCLCRANGHETISSVCAPNHQTEASAPRKHDSCNTSELPILTRRCSTIQKPCSRCFMHRLAVSRPSTMLQTIMANCTYTRQDLFSSEGSQCMLNTHSHKNMGRLGIQLTCPPCPFEVSASESFTS